MKLNGRGLQWGQFVNIQFLHKHFFLPQFIHSPPKGTFSSFYVEFFFFFDDFLSACVCVSDNENWIINFVSLFLIAIYHRCRHCECNSTVVTELFLLFHSSWVQKTNCVWLFFHRTVAHNSRCLNYFLYFFSILSFSLSGYKLSSKSNGSKYLYWLNLWLNCLSMNQNLLHIKVCIKIGWTHEI